MATQMARPVSFRRHVVIYLVMIAVTCVLLFPIYWMVTISLKTPKDIYRLPSLVPKVVTLDNYHNVLFKQHFLTAIKNSLIVASCVTVIAVFISCLAAYSLVRFRYRFRGVVGRLILFGYLMPTSLLFIPLSIIVARLHLGNSLHGLIIVYLTFSLPLSTWLLSGFFRSVPADLEEQAMVDGSTRMGALLRILLPLSLPGIVAVSIFTFTGAWNELLLALIFISSDDKRTVALGLQYLITGDVFQWGPIMAGSVLSAAPIIILYFITQRFMVQGMTLGSVKG